MDDDPVQSTRSQIQDVLNYIWATTGKITPDKFKIGVGWDDWTELGGNPKKPSLRLLDIKDQTFEVIPVPGLPKGKIALIWQ